MNSDSVKINFLKFLEKNNLKITSVIKIKNEKECLIFPKIKSISGVSFYTFLKSSREFCNYNIIFAEKKAEKVIDLSQIPISTRTILEKYGKNIQGIIMKKKNYIEHIMSEDELKSIEYSLDIPYIDEIEKELPKIYYFYEFDYIQKNFPVMIKILEQIKKFTKNLIYKEVTGYFNESYKIIEKRFNDFNESLIPDPSISSNLSKLKSLQNSKNPDPELIRYVKERLEESLHVHYKYEEEIEYLNGILNKSYDIRDKLKNMKQVIKNPNNMEMIKNGFYSNKN